MRTRLFTRSASITEGCEVKTGPKGSYEASIVIRNIRIMTFKLKANLADTIDGAQN